MKVSKTGKITALSKTGKATVTVTLASGKTAKIRVTVQKGTVKTTKIQGLPSRLTLKRGTKTKLNPMILPITSQEKATYSSSDKKVVTVTSKGVLLAKKSGTAIITVKSGKKKCTVKVTVPKTRTTDIRNVPAKLQLKKGKTYTLKPKLVPAGSEEKVTYKTSNKKVAAVSSSGKITAKSKGIAKITVKSGKRQAVVNLTVK